MVRHRTRGALAAIAAGVLAACTLSSPPSVVPVASEEQPAAPIGAPAELHPIASAAAPAPQAPRRAQADAITHTVHIERDVRIPVSDGSYVAADVFRPGASGKYPVIVTASPFGKDRHYSDHPIGKLQYARLAEQGPHIGWDAPNPDWWVPFGYVVIRIDVRGSGKSPGQLDPLSPREIEDYADAIEWAGVQPWSNGRVGLLGSGYAATNQWLVAARRPKHLAALIAYESGSDFYRHVTHQGGIPTNAFVERWWQASAPPFTSVGRLGESVKLTSRADFPKKVRTAPLDGELYRDRSVEWSRVLVPFLAAGNWTSPGPHLRGSTEAFWRAASRQRWLIVHMGESPMGLYTLATRLAHKRFFDFWLKGVDTGLLEQPRVQLLTRRGDGLLERRHASTFPLPGTRWMRYFLDASSGTLGTSTPPTAGATAFSSERGARTTKTVFTTAPFARDIEITGPIKLKVWASSSRTDMDVVAVLRYIGPDGREVRLPGTSHPLGGLTHGGLRASHRKLDPTLSREYRPYHAHDSAQPVTPGEPVELDIEIQPMSMVLLKGARLALELRAGDDESTSVSAKPAARRGGASLVSTGPRSARPRITIHSGQERPSYLFLPMLAGK
jgi:hypothetical protein